MGNGDSPKPGGGRGGGHDTGPPHVSSDQPETQPDDSSSASIGKITSSLRKKLRREKAKEAAAAATTAGEGEKLTSALAETSADAEEPPSTPAKAASKTDDKEKQATPKTAASKGSSQSSFATPRTQVSKGSSQYATPKQDPKGDDDDPSVEKDSTAIAKGKGKAKEKTPATPANPASKADEEEKYTTPVTAASKTSSKDIFDTPVELPKTPFRGFPGAEKDDPFVDKDSSTIIKGKGKAKEVKFDSPVPWAKDDDKNDDGDSATVKKKPAPAAQDDDTVKRSTATGKPRETGASPTPASKSASTSATNDPHPLEDFNTTPAPAPALASPFRPDVASPFRVDLFSTGPPPLSPSPPLPDTTSEEPRETQSAASSPVGLGSAPPLSPREPGGAIPPPPGGLSEKESSKLKTIAAVPRSPLVGEAKRSRDSLRPVAFGQTKRAQPGNIPLKHEEGGGSPEAGRARGEEMRAQYLRDRGMRPKVGADADRVSQDSFSEATEGEKSVPAGGESDEDDDKDDREGWGAYGHDPNAHLYSERWDIGYGKKDPLPDALEYRLEQPQTLMDAFLRIEQLEEELRSGEVKGDPVTVAAASAAAADAAEAEVAAAAARLQAVEEQNRTLGEKLDGAVKTFSDRVEAVRRDLAEVKNKGGHGASADQAFASRVKAGILILIPLVAVWGLGNGAWERNKMLGKYEGVYVNGGFNGLRSFAIFETGEYFILYTIFSACIGGGVGWLFQTIT